MTKPPPTPRDELTSTQARRMLAQMGENGKPPEHGISHVNVGNESYLRIIETVYVRDLVRAAEGASFKLVQGTYGAGKTHFLYCVRDLAWRNGLLTALVTMSPKETPFNRPVAVYRAVAQRLELPRGADGESTRGIDDILRQRIETLVAADGVDTTRAWVDTALARATITRHSFRDATAAFARAILDRDEPTARKLAAWLRGEDISASEVKSVGVYEVPSNENGFAMLRSLVQIVHRAGFAGTALLLDEAERRLSVEAKPTKSTSETIDHLRELIDLCGRSELPRTLILYAVTPAFMRDVVPMYPALQQRLGQPVQYLSTNNPKAPLIDLEALDLEPRRLLVEVGKRLARVAATAYEWTPDDKLLDSNLERFAEMVAAEQLESGHRRFFVKVWIRLLDELRLGKPRALSEAEIRALVRGEQELLDSDEAGEPAASSTVGMFLGIPIKRKRDKPRS
jgi:hypothetical protein